MKANPITPAELAALKALEKCGDCHGRGWLVGECHPYEWCGTCEGLGWTGPDDNALPGVTMRVVSSRLQELIAAAERLHTVEAECERMRDGASKLAAGDGLTTDLASEGAAQALDEVLGLIRSGE